MHEVLLTPFQGRNNPNVQLRRLCWTSNKVNAPQVRFFKHRETEAKVDLNLNVEQHTMVRVNPNVMIFQYIL